MLVRYNIRQQVKKTMIPKNNTNPTHPLWNACRVQEWGIDIVNDKVHCENTGEIPRRRTFN